MSAATPLKQLIGALRVKQARLARECGISPGTLADLVNHGKWPSRDPRALRDALARALRALGASAAQINRALPAPMKQNARRCTAGRSAAAPASTGATPSVETEKETDMLLQKQTLAQDTRQHFGLAADPFRADVTQASDVFVSKDIRYVRETLWQHARHGGQMLAIVGESGSGKSTLVADFKDRLAREGRDVLVIEPSVLYMEESDTKGKTLKSAAIVQAILATVALSEAPKRDAETRARQVQKILTAGHRAGQRYVLLIEEAHCLPTATLKHLKRFAELRDGLAFLLAIVLVAQPELRQRLSVANAEVREVAQRVELVDLPPLGRNLDEYIQFKLARVGADAAKVITKDGIDALRERLSFSRRTGKSASVTDHVSLAYPLAVANALTAAMNLAASLGAPVVDADIVREAQ
ncbi:MAG: AAA family ATPase [Burkholderiaceae bacterium]|jgi:type II secretory pathway predicted ATPase ExeA|nr:AAA family ATPase [Burkholderiaceae bacterium]